MMNRIGTIPAYGANSKAIRHGIGSRASALHSSTSDGRQSVGTAGILSTRIIRPIWERTESIRSCLLFLNFAQFFLPSIQPKPSEKSRNSKHSKRCPRLPLDCSAGLYIAQDLPRRARAEGSPDPGPRRRLDNDIGYRGNTGRDQDKKTK